MLYRNLVGVFMLVANVFSADSSSFHEIKNLYDLYGNDKYMISEEITQRSHALQAALIAHLAGAPEDLIIALMLHDIGQISSKEHLGDLQYLHAQHDEVGAEWLKTHGFPDFVCDVVRFHTAAKVILCIENTLYFDALSQASKDSYFIQRDKYLSEPNLVTLNALSHHPRVEDIKYARRCDDMAKILNLNEENTLPSFDMYHEMLLRVCQQKGSPGRPNWKENLSNFYSLMITNRSEFEDLIKKQVKLLPCTFAR